MPAQPIRVRLTRFAEPWQSAVTTAIVLTLLVVGGFLANLATAVLPGYHRRRRMRLQAERLGPKWLADSPEAFEGVRVRAGGGGK